MVESTHCTIYSRLSKPRLSLIQADLSYLLRALLSRRLGATSTLSTSQQPRLSKAQYSCHTVHRSTAYPASIELGIPPAQIWNFRFQFLPCGGESYRTICGSITYPDFPAQGRAFQDKIWGVYSYHAKYNLSSTTVRRYNLWMLAKVWFIILQRGSAQSSLLIIPHICSKLALLNTALQQMLLGASFGENCCGCGGACFWSWGAATFKLGLLWMELMLTVYLSASVAGVHS